MEKHLSDTPQSSALPSPRLIAALNAQIRCTPASLASLASHVPGKWTPNLPKGSSTSAGSKSGVICAFSGHVCPLSFLLVD